MRTILTITAALALAAPPVGAQCERHGTEVDLHASPSAAAAAAKKTQKLVMVLHVSGHFEDPGFT